MARAKHRRGKAGQNGNGMLSSSFDAVVPMLCVTMAALAVMGAEAFRAKDEDMPLGGLGIVGLVGAAIAAALLWDRNTSSFGVIVADNFGLFVTLVLIIVGVLTIMFSAPVVRRDALPKGDYYALVLFSIAGMIMMAVANDLLVVFIALEILSIGVYVLTGIRRQDPRATEAALKYFLLGAFSSAFFLYGIAFTYGLTGSTRLDRVGTYVAAQSMSDNPLLVVALGLLLWNYFGRTPTPSTPTGTQTTSARIPEVPTPGRVLGAAEVTRLTEDLKGALNSATTTLAGIKDAATAETALPEIEKINGNLDTAYGLFDRVPVASKGTIVSFVKDQMGKLHELIDKVKALPGLGDKVKAAVDAMLAKVKAFMA